MKSREVEELHNKPVAELERMLKECRERLRVLQFDLAAGKVKNVGELRALRKDIARILTVMKASPGDETKG